MWVSHTINPEIVPYKKPQIEKFYYSIGEVAKIINVNPSLIRYWEKEFDVIQPQKNKKGNRFFTTKDIEQLKLIYFLVKEKGMTLKGARQSLKKNKHKIIENYELTDRLKKIRNMLKEIYNNIVDTETDKSRNSESENNI